MKRVALLCALVFAAAPVSWAQTAPPSASTTQIDPVRLDLARQLVETSGSEKQLAAQMDALYGSMFAKMAANLPPERQSAMAAVQGAMRQEMHNLIPTLIDISVSAYARNFTDQELRDIIAFRRTPTGQAMIRKTPIIQQETVSEIVPLIMRDMPHLMHASVEAACKAQTCSPEMRAQLDGAVQAALRQDGAGRSQPSQVAPRPPSAS